MSTSRDKNLDELLGQAVELRPRPDFAKWCYDHPEAVDALMSLPRIVATRRSTMIRIARYSMSAAAVILFLVAAAWWIFFSGSEKTAWAQAMDRLTQVRSATCSLRTHHSGFPEIAKAYLEGSRVRVEDPNRFYIIDFLQGKAVWAERLSKTAAMVDLKKQPAEPIVLGSNPLSDLVEMRNAPAERLPDEQLDDTLCKVYRVKDTSFMGYKVPWVKLWLDPRSKLPVQIHSVVADSRAMTFNDFHWNEPFDKRLLELALPEGYKVMAAPATEKAPAAAVTPPSRGAAPQTGTKEDGKAEAGHEIPTEEIAKSLDMLGQRIEANYKAIESWSGTFDVKARFRRTRDPQYEEVSHVAVQFFAEPGKDRIRINNRAVEPIRILGNSGMRPTVELPESRWVRTPEELLRFPVSDLRHSVDGFPGIEGLTPGKPFRVLYREPPKAAQQYVFQGYVDPLSFFGSGGQQISWKMCSMLAGVLRGEQFPDQTEYLKKNLAFLKRSSAGGTQYVLIQHMKPAGSGGTIEWVFSSEAGFNVVSSDFHAQGRPVQTELYKFRKVKGCFIPFHCEIKTYHDQTTPTQHRVFTLQDTQANEPIDPAIFQAQSMGLQYGDRMVDQIEHEMYVFDGKELVPARKFKLQPAAEAKRDKSVRDQSIENMRRIALAMHFYADAKRTFPPAYVADKNGKPLLSWRVLILPYLEQEPLYKQFHLDEAWDSPHNAQLIARMPAVFKSPASKVADQGKTNYLTVRGESTVSPGAKGIGIAEIRDGTSNTIMTVEVSDTKAVAWTAPDDFQYDPRDPVSGLVGLRPDGFLAGLADGSVRFIWSSISPADLKALFSRNGGEKVGPEALGQ